MKTLYPELPTFATHHLQRDGEHVLYVEESGNPDGLAVIFLHGGPGSGCKPEHRRYFNAAGYRIIIFDQRGCHRSIPNGCIDHNTTQLLVADMEAIRQQLNLDTWVLFGGSWGATLALLYAQQYPQFVAGMILRGTFLARQADLDWFVGADGVSRIFPDYWQDFMAAFTDVAADERMLVLYERVFGDDEAVKLQAARAWALWAGRVVTHSLDMGQAYALDDDSVALLNEVRIEIHYGKNGYFIKENQILDNVSSLPNVPLTLIHGRRDLTCLPESSWALHRCLPQSELVMVAGVGHLAAEPAMVDALVCATDGMLAKLT